MRVALALLALVAVATAANFVDIDAAALNGWTVNGVTSTVGGADALAVGAYSTIKTTIAATETAPTAAFAVWYAADCATNPVVTDAATALTASLLATAVSDGAASPVYDLYLKKSALTAAATSLKVCVWSDNAAGTTAANRIGSVNLVNIVAADATITATHVTKVEVVGGGMDFIYGDEVTFTGAAFAQNEIFSLGDAPNADAANVGAFAITVNPTAAATTLKSMPYLGAADAAGLKPWVAKGGFQTLGVAQTVTIDYKFQTSVATLNKVNDMTYPKMNYTSGEMVTFTVAKNNSAQGAGFFVVALKGAGTAADCDKAVTDKKAIYAEDGVKSKPWMVPNVTAGTKSESYSVWVKAANVTVGGNMLACTAQVGWNVVAVPKPVVPTPAPAPAPAPGPVAPAPAAASTTGTSSASAVRGGLLAAFACVLAGLGVSAAF